MSRHDRRLKAIKTKLIVYSDSQRNLDPQPRLWSPPFYGEDLTGIDLAGLDLNRVHFLGCTLTDANFSRAVLERTDFSGCRLDGVNFTSADMRGAILTGATTRGSLLKGTDLRYAILTAADLCDTRLEGVILPDFSLVPEEGSFMAYKKVANIDSPDDFMIAQLLIPDDALRTSSLVGRKCRANKAVVLRFYTAAKEEIIEDVVGLSVTQLRQKEWSEAEITDKDLEDITAYRQGQTVYSDSFDDDIRVECTNGIHFFMTFKEAVKYEY